MPLHPHLRQELQLAVGAAVEPVLDRHGFVVGVVVCPRGAEILWRWRGEEGALGLLVINNDEAKWHSPREGRDQSKRTRGQGAQAGVDTVAYHGSRGTHDDSVGVLHAADVEDPGDAGELLRVAPGRGRRRGAHLEGQGGWAGGEAGQNSSG